MLSLRQRRKPLYQGTVRRSEEPQQGGYGVGAKIFDGGMSLLIGWPWLRVSVRLITGNEAVQPIGQGLALIERFGFARTEHEPEDDAQNRDEQKDGQYA